ncbi:uncharacterized protein UDID_17823 [Ustilago sp. UG-2017a]|nr:uncharacterized protein UDID_17823 [Ustilago sp. UG-2017a]
MELGNAMRKWQGLSFYAAEAVLGDKTAMPTSSAIGWCAGPGLQPHTQPRKARKGGRDRQARARARARAMHLKKAKKKGPMRARSTFYHTKLHCKARQPASSSCLAIVEACVSLLKLFPILPSDSHPSSALNLSDCSTCICSPAHLSQPLQRQSALYGNPVSGLPDLLLAREASRPPNMQGANWLYSKVWFCWRRQEPEAEGSCTKLQKEQEGEAKAKKK